MRYLPMLLLFACLDAQAQPVTRFEISPNPVASGGLVSGTLEVNPLYFVVSETPEGPSANVVIEGSSIQLVLEVVQVLSPGPGPTQVAFAFPAPNAGSYDVSYVATVVEPFPGETVFREPLGSLIVLGGAGVPEPRMVPGGSLLSHLFLVMCLPLATLVASRHWRSQS